DVDEAIVEDELDLDVGVSPEKRAHQWSEVALAEAHRSADPHAAARRRLPGGDLALGLLEIGEDALAALVEAPGRVGESYRARRAVEGADAEPILAGRHPTAGRPAP